MTRIGLLSDTHAYWDEKYLEYFEPCDEIWHAGDIGSLEVAQKLAAFRPFRAVQSRQETAFRSGCPPSGSCHISVTITDRLIAMIGAMSRQLPPRLPLPSD